MKGKIAISLLAINILVGSTAFARTPTFTNDAKYTRGVGNCCYYIDSTASSYSNQITSAANNWENTGFGWNPIYMTGVSSNYATHMDFYSRNPSTDVHFNDNILGYTTFFNSDGTLVARRTYDPTYNYFYAEVVFNTASSDSWDYRTAKHEMGHAFGLSHNESSYSIMHPNIQDTYVTTVQQCDQDTINYLYN